MGEGVAALYRHSRVSGNPELYSHRPAYYQSAFLDSRLRGNDGRGGGMTVVEGEFNLLLGKPMPTYSQLSL